MSRVESMWTAHVEQLCGGDPDHLPVRFLRVALDWGCRPLAHCRSPPFGRRHPPVWLRRLVE